MNLKEIIDIIEGKLYTDGVRIDWDIKGACAADLMSDVLAMAKPDAILLTGLCNPQVIRTAQMADVRAIAFVRGKRPSCEMIELAVTENIPLISSPFGMFELCGRLFEAGLSSFERDLQSSNDY